MSFSAPPFRPPLHFELRSVQVERSANHAVAQGIDNACRIEPGSGAGLSWDAPQIHRTGNLWVSGVPEPRIWALASAGLLDLAWRRHLKHGG